MKDLVDLMNMHDGFRLIKSNAMLRPKYKDMANVDAIQLEDYFIRLNGFQIKSEFDLKREKQ